jgi:hypothetical protein
LSGGGLSGGEVSTDTTAMVSSNGFVDCLAEVVPEMPPVCHLNHLRRTRHHPRRAARLDHHTSTVTIETLYDDSTQMREHHLKTLSITPGSNA